MEEECESVCVYKWTFTLPENGQMNEHYVICWSWTLAEFIISTVVREKHILFDNAEGGSRPHEITMKYQFYMEN